MENPRGLHRQRAVHVNREVLMSLHQSVRLDLPQEIEHFLGSAHCKGRNYHIAAPVERGLQDFRQFSHVVHLFSGMEPVTVGRFHHHIIRLKGIFRIFDQRMTTVSDISRKYNLLRHIPFRRPDFNAGRAKQMAYIRKPDLNIFTYRHFTVIITGNKPPDGAIRILHGVKRFYHLILCTSLRLAVFPFRLLHLNMRTVPEHDITQVAGRRRRIDFAPKSPCIQKRK